LTALTTPLHAQQRPRITGASHLSVYSSDAAKTEAFYVHDLGAMKQTDPENPAGIRYVFSPTQFIEVLPLEGPVSQVSRFDHAAFNVADVGTLRLYLATKGVTVPDRVEETTDGARYFEIKDPEGNRIQFVQPPAHPSPVPHNDLS